MGKPSFAVVNLSGPRVKTRKFFKKLILDAKLRGYEVSKKELIIASMLFIKAALGSSQANGSELVETARAGADMYAFNGDLALYILGEILRETDAFNLIPWVNYAAVEIKR